MIHHLYTHWLTKEKDLYFIKKHLLASAGGGFGLYIGKAMVIIELNWQGWRWWFYALYSSLFVMCTSLLSSAPLKNITLCVSVIREWCMLLFMSVRYFFTSLCATYLFGYFFMKEIVIVEALKLDDVEPGMYMLHCLPLRLAGAEGSPVRCILIKWSRHWGFEVLYQLKRPL